jgi:LytS/YehU family sensor histidine kinase
MLYEKVDANHKVSLENEIRHINNYIDLEKMRHYGRIHLNFSIEGDTPGKRIVPLLLFPLIENACKHGILTDAAKPVTIQLTVTDNQLSLVLQNFNNHNYKDQTGGIGIQNVQKRLDLIYGSNYTFEVHKTDTEYKVNLHVPL